MKVKGFKKKGKGPKRKGIWGIKTKTLRMILEASRETYPNEFSATLRARAVSSTRA